MVNKRVVVTGGAGFLGSHVVKMLLAKDNTVTVLDDFSNGKMENLDAVKDDKRLTVIKGDITNLEDVQRAFKNSDIIIHFAVLGLRQSIKEPDRVTEVIVNGTLNCLGTALENEVELFLNCSSSRHANVHLILFKMLEL